MVGSYKVIVVKMIVQIRLIRSNRTGYTYRKRII